VDGQFKRCKCCQRELPLSKFNAARDAYTDEARWVRNVCNRCYHKPKWERESLAAAAVTYVQLALW